MVAITITSLSGAVLLLAIESSVETSSDAVDRMIAEGLAGQIVHEVLSKRFVATGVSPLDTGLGCSSSEAQGSGRERYNDTDDFDDFSAKPAEGVWGEALGTGNDSGGARNANFCVPSNYFQRWRQRIEVYFVNANDPSRRLTSGSSYYRAVEVNIEYVDSQGIVKPLACRRRVYAYVPPPTN